MRLNSFLAHAGVASRRKADELIKSGRVTVNGALGQLNSDVSANDRIKVDGQWIKLEQHRYILLNKPAGYITTLKDEKGRRKVVDLIDIKERIVPVGRLDYDTTGVLLLTNDGELANRLMHPSYEVDKVYEATVTGDIKPDKLRALSQGVELDDGKTAPATVRQISEDKIELTIHEGRKHQVKRMLAAVDMKIKRLHRSKYGPFDIKGLKPGEWRDLNPEELKSIKL